MPGQLPHHHNGFIGATRNGEAAARQPPTPPPKPLRSNFELDKHRNAMGRYVMDDSETGTHLVF
jgi:hypothetical protein